MKKQLWIVRVCVDGSNEEWFDNPILECLRYAGIINVHAARTPSGHQVFDLFPPKGSWGSKDWAEMNAARMRTFGFNAVTAPSTEEYVP